MLSPSSTDAAYRSAVLNSHTNRTLATGSVSRTLAMPAAAVSHSSASPSAMGGSYLGGTSSASATAARTSAPLASALTGGGGGGGGASNSSPSVYSASESALRMELEHRTSELQLKGKTISKLEAEVLHHLKEAELARTREEDHVQAIAATAKREAEQNSLKMLEVKSLLIASDEEKEHLKQRVGDLEVEVRTLTKLEIKVRENERVLEDRQDRIEELRRERVALEDKLQSIQRNDQTKMLEGRLEAVQALADQANNRAEDAENFLKARGAELDSTTVEMRSKEESIRTLERTVGARDVAIESLNKDIAVWERRVLDAELRTEAARKQALHEQELHKDREASLNAQLDLIREDVRSAVKVAGDHEISLAKSETEMNLQTSHLEQLQISLEREVEFKESVEGRLRSYQQQVDAKESELAKQDVLSRSLRSEVDQQKSLIDTLRTELDSMRDQLREAAADRDEAMSSVSRLEGVEEKLQVLKGIHMRQGEDMGVGSQQLLRTKERLAEAEIIINKLEQLQVQLRDVQRESHVRGEAVEIALREKQQLAQELDAAMQHIQLAEGAACVNEAKLVAERDRRKDVERRLMALETGYVGNMAVHGRYEALKTFLEGSSNESAKAQQLSFTLIEEVKVLENRLRDSEGNLDKAREKGRKLDIEVAGMKVELQQNREAKSRLELMEKELQMANERAFELKKDGVQSEVVQNRYKELQSMHHSSSVELHELRSQLQSMRTEYHSTRVELEACRVGKEAAEGALNEEMNHREMDRSRLIRAQEEAQAGSPNRRSGGAATLEQATIAALQATLSDERSSREALIDRLRESNRQQEANQALIAHLQAQQATVGPTSPIRGHSLGGAGSPVSGRTSRVLAEAETLRGTAELNVLRSDNSRLESALQAADVRFDDQQKRLDEVSLQLRGALSEMTNYTSAGRSARSPVRSARSPPRSVMQTQTSPSPARYNARARTPISRPRSSVQTSIPLNIHSDPQSVALNSPLSVTTPNRTRVSVNTSATSATAMASSGVASSPASGKFKVRVAPTKGAQPAVRHVYQPSLEESLVEAEALAEIHSFSAAAAQSPRDREASPVSSPIRAVTSPRRQHQQANNTTNNTNTPMRKPVFGSTGSRGLSAKKQATSSNRTPRALTPRATATLGGGSAVESTNLRAQNTDLSLQLAEAKSQLASILKSPRQTGAERTTPQRTLPSTTRGMANVGTTSVYSPPRPRK